MATLGERLLKEAAKHIGEEYYHGADVDFEAPNYSGPWDCAEFVSYVVYRVTGKVLGCLDDDVDLADVEPFTGGWRRDIRDEHGVRRIEVEQAIHTPGAILLRYPRLKHVVFSDGEGGTIEAKSASAGVCRSGAWGRGWNYACVIE